MAVASQPQRRRWYQFRLRTLFATLTLLCLGFAWLGAKARQAQEQARAIETVYKLDGHVGYDLQRTEVDANGVAIITFTGGYPHWLLELLGYDFFATVTEVSFSTPNHQFTNSDLVFLQGLRELLRLDLQHAAITDAGLKQLACLSQLQELDLSFTDISGSGLSYLSGLTELTSLNLSYTFIDDATLDHLQSLPQLKSLDLANTAVTAKGLEKLTSMTHLEELCLSWSTVRGAGLIPLQKMKQLHSLVICEVDNQLDASQELSKALPNLRISFKAVWPASHRPKRRDLLRDFNLLP